MCVGLLCSMKLFSAESHLCFFLMSVKIFTWSAPICLRYLSRSPAQALSKPSSATWENTKPSTRMKFRPIIMTEALVHLPDTSTFLETWDIGRYLLFWRLKLLSQDQIPNTAAHKQKPKNTSGGIILLKITLNICQHGTKGIHYVSPFTLLILAFLLTTCTAQQ